MSMKLKNANEVRDYLWDKLKLSGRAIIFWIADFGFAPDAMGSGMIESIDALYETDYVYDLGDENPETERFDVYGVDSYMIGDGEADHADHDDIDVLSEVNAKSPIAFDAFLREYADGLVHLNEGKVDNPYYDPEAEDDEEDDEDESEI